MEKDILCCKYSPNAKYVVAGHTEGIVRVYESRTGELMRKLIREDLKEEVPVTSVHFRSQSSKTDNTTMLTTCNYENKKINSVTVLYYFLCKVSVN